MADCAAYEGNRLQRGQPRRCNSLRSRTWKAHRSCMRALRLVQGKRLAVLAQPLARSIRRLECGNNLIPISNEPSQLSPKLLSFHFELARTRSCPV
eukprot:5487919-Pleurochrysis_carterae.AAC.2